MKYIELIIFIKESHSEEIEELAEQIKDFIYNNSDEEIGPVEDVTYKIKENDEVVIMRYPCLMEDEGRHHFISGPISREKAENWIKSQKNEYFKPSDYYIVIKDD